MFELYTTLCCPCVVDLSLEYLNVLYATNVLYHNVYNLYNYDNVITKYNIIPFTIITTTYLHCMNQKSTNPVS